MKCPYCIKICSKCQRLLVANNINFYKKKTGKYNVRAICKKCELDINSTYRDENRIEINEQKRQHYKNNKDEISKKQKEKYKENKDEISKRNKQYRDTHKEELKEYRKKYYKENKNNILESQKKYYEDNKEEILKKHKEYYENNKEKLKTYRICNKERILKNKKQWRLNNPEKVFNSHVNRRLKEENQGNGISKEQWLEMMEFFNWCCAYSGEYIGGNDNKDRSIDHIIPLNKNGEHEIWNCIPMLRKYNNGKQDQNMLEWYILQPFYSKERLNKIYEWIKIAEEKYKK